jgi:iron complex transport system substrate-binding protein
VSVTGGAGWRWRARRSASLVVLALAGCAGEPRPEPDAGPRRIAVMAPAAAETLALLGAAEQVVAVGDWVTWPPELAARPALGAYDAPSPERLLELEVDTLITSASVAGRREREEIARLGIHVVELDTATFEGTLAAIEELGALVRREARAAELVASIRTRLAEIGRRARVAEPRRVLVVVGREPLYVAGPGSHVDELVRLAGGVNVAADAGSTYALVSLETVLARAPEVILDTADNRGGALRGAAAGEWARWPFLPAVAEGRVFHVDPWRIAIPGPRLGEMAELVARLVHPEIFGVASTAEMSVLPGADG